MLMNRTYASENIVKKQLTRKVLFIIKLHLL